jgi:hypothetical protein
MVYRTHGHGITSQAGHIEVRGSICIHGQRSKSRYTNYICMRKTVEDWERAKEKEITKDHGYIVW